MSINEYELAQDTKLNLNTTIQENNINSLIPISKNQKIVQMIYP